MTGQIRITQDQEHCLRVLLHRGSLTFPSPGEGFYGIWEYELIALTRLDEPLVWRRRTTLPARAVREDNRWGWVWPWKYRLTRRGRAVVEDLAVRDLTRDSVAL